MIFKCLILFDNGFKMIWFNVLKIVIIVIVLVVVVVLSFISWILMFFIILIKYKLFIYDVNNMINNKYICFVFNIFFVVYFLVFVLWIVFWFVVWWIK